LSISSEALNTPSPLSISVVKDSTLVDTTLSSLHFIMAQKYDLEKVSFPIEIDYVLGTSTSFGGNEALKFFWHSRKQHFLKHSNEI